jgi:uncharacterized protein YcgI (DUF1989 family)
MAKARSRTDPTVKMAVRVDSTEIKYEGDGAFLSAELPRLIDAITRSHNTRVKAALAQDIEASQALHSNLEESQARSARLEEQLIQRVSAFGQAVADYLALVAGGSGQQQLLDATKQMQETQMSFNLQYLQLQSQMQHENRSYTMVSNIMKTKHDAVKNSISNVR